MTFRIIVRWPQWHFLEHSARTSLNAGAPRGSDPGLLVERDVQRRQHGRSPRFSLPKRDPGLWRLRVRILLWAELPPGQAPGPASNLTAPQGHVPEEPESQSDRHQDEEPSTGKDAEQREHRRDGQSHPNHREPIPAHLAHDAPVRIGRDLPGVPATAALLAGPSLAVADVADLAAVTADRDGRAAHPRAPQTKRQPRRRTARPVTTHKALALLSALTENRAHYRMVSEGRHGSRVVTRYWG
jgi:hypothetical protein